MGAKKQCRVKDEEFDQLVDAFDRYGDKNGTEAQLNAVTSLLRVAYHLISAADWARLMAQQTDIDMDKYGEDED